MGKPEEDRKNDWRWRRRIEIRGLALRDAVDMEVRLDGANETFLEKVGLQLIQ